MTDKMPGIRLMSEWAGVGAEEGERESDTLPQIPGKTWGQYRNEPERVRILVSIAEHCMPPLVPLPQGGLGCRGPAFETGVCEGWKGMPGC